ncbi:hypothetical protein ACJMK2_040142 [Sinanodonta woodiana]|uniref:Uncharacterized protein n=1 Tax=Sinanodonta woodiana TaxID=1069815 RepID=A0ABD3WE47_SINWO
MFSAELQTWALLFSTVLLGVGANPFLAVEPPKIGTPDCYSADALCDVAFNFTSLHLSSSQPICKCPGDKVCPRGWGDTNKSIYTVIQMQGQEVNMKMSYCSPIARHDQICGEFQPVLIMKGSGPFTFEMATSMNCTCIGRQLYLNRSWSKGVVSYMEYSCEKGTPDCYSADALCDVTFNYTSLHLSSSQPICRCPGDKVCPRGWGDTNQSIYTVIRMQGQEVNMKMSYCSPNARHDQICGEFKPVLILKGSGPFTFEMATSMNCTCTARQLYLNRSWSKGVVSYMEYSCGKPICYSNRSSGEICMWVERVHDPDSQIQYRYEHKYPCRCHSKQECRILHDTLPTKLMDPVPGYCENN